MLCGCMTRIVLPRTQTVIVVAYTWTTETNCGDFEGVERPTMMLVSLDGHIHEFSIDSSIAIGACN
jgi:hypothetical protein